MTEGAEPSFNVQAAPFAIYARGCGPHCRHLGNPIAHRLFLTIVLVAELALPLIQTARSMPLEQLRPAVALDPEPRRSSSFFEGEPTSSPDTFEDDGNGSASGTRKDAGMTLTKLGGVGGVTRSGSWGRSTASGVGLDEATHSSSQREDWKQGEGSGEGSKTRRPSAKASGNSEDNLPSSSSSDVPSSSSRTSTSSYSAAAFSLMSVSNRSSIAGSSSSASSTRSRAPSDSSQRHSLSPPNSRGRDSESDATSVGGAPSEGPSSDATCTDISQDELSASERDRSSAPHQGGVRTVSSGRVSSLGSLGTFPSRHDQSIMTPSRALAVETENASFQRPEPTLLSSSGNGKAREVVDNCDAGRTLRSSGQSSSLSSSPRASSSSASISPITPRTPSYDPICVPSRRTGADLTVEPTRAQTANLHLRRLTQELSASPLNEASEDFQPPLPRRHSGVFLSRTRSQLAQHPSVNSRFAGAGGGRAAARERAGYSIEYDNAPFSVLEARSNASQHRGAASQPPSPAARTVPNSPWALSPIAMERTPTPASISSPTSVGNSETGWLSRSLVSQNSSFASLAPLSDIAPLLSSKTKAGNHSAPDLQEDVESTAGPSTGSDTTEGASTSRSGLLRPKSKPIPAPLETQASNANFTSLQVLSRSPHPSSSSAPDEKVASIGLGIDGSLSPGLPTRPPMSRSSTTTSMVMRTPTTAEWSRFLESQGMDPVVAGRRSRTPTARSAASSRRSSRLGMSRPVAADTDSDDDSASDDSTLEATPDVAESMKHLNLSRGGSRVASSAGGDPRLADDLESFDEEDELRDPRRDSSSSNEPMDALHEVISRPASRRASPHSSPRIPRSPAMTPLTVHRPVVTSDLPEGPDFSAPRSPSRLKRADRETAAVVLGYPLPPPGQSRSIHDFVIISDIGRGAYGLVKKARLKGLDGHPVGVSSSYDMRMCA